MAKSHETGLTRFLRTALSFILAGVISILGMSVCASSFIMKDTNIEKYFSSYQYTCAVRDDLIDYVNSVYTKNGIDKSNVEAIITYDLVNECVDNYAGHYISYRVGYDEQAYLLSIETVCTSIEADIKAQLDSANIEYSSDAVNNIVNSIRSYYDDIVQINGVDKLKPVLNVGVPALYVTMGVSAFFFIFITLIIIFLGEKRYRSFRAISISFLTSGLFELCLAGIVYIISQVKKLDVYPSYFGHQVIEYVNYSISMVIIFAMLTLLFALAIAVLAWFKKIKGKR